MDGAYVNEISLSQQKAIAIIPKITGFLSIMGSLWILLEVVTDKKKLHSMYHRIMLCISLSDIISSFWSYFLSSWMLPSEAYSGEFGTFFGASGNWTTCNLQGFMFQLGVATPLYNGALSLYYLLLLRYNWTPKQMARQIEPYIHGFIVTFALASATAPLFMTLYNPSVSSWCLITEYPYNCVSTTDDEGRSRQRYLSSPKESSSPLLRSGTSSSNATTSIIRQREMSLINYTPLDEPPECLRGRSESFATLIQWLFAFIPIWFVIAFTTINMIVVYLTVRHQEKKMERKYKFYGMAKKLERKKHEQQQQQQQQQQQRQQQGEQSPVPATSPSMLERSSPVASRPIARRKKRESERIFTISILYTSSFYVTFGFYTILNALSMARRFESVNSNAVLAIVLLNNILLPLEGFFNCLVYLYPRYQRYKEQHEKERYEAYLKQQQLLEKKHHHSSANIQSAVNLQVAGNSGRTQNQSTKENIASISHHHSTSEHFHPQGTSGMLSSTGAVATSLVTAAPYQGSRNQAPPPEGTSNNPILIHSTSNVSDLGVSNREQIIMAKKTNQHKVRPPIAPNATRKEKIKHFCYKNILPDFESLWETFERGWTREDREDDDYKLGGEDCSIAMVSMMSTDALGNVTPKDRNRGRSNSALMIGTSIAFDHPPASTSNDNNNDNIALNKSSSGGARIENSQPQFHNVSILQDSVALMSSDVTISEAAGFTSSEGKEASSGVLDSSATAHMNGEGSSS